MARTRIRPGDETNRARREPEHTTRAERLVTKQCAGVATPYTQSLGTRAETCIYCGAGIAPKGLAREHVILRAFGLFERNLTITSVCRECNQYFGRTIDVILARDSIEAVYRLHEITKARRNVSKWSQKYLTFDIPGPGSLGRTRVRPILYGDDAVMVPEDQLSREGCRPQSPQGTRDVSNTCGPLRIEERTIRATARVCPDHLRGVAKTAFNYMAYCAGRIGLPDLPLDQRFDSIREFIRYGRFTGRPPVDVGEGPVLTGDSEYWRRRGHVVALSQDDVTRIVAVVSFFGQSRYYVWLTAQPWGLFLPSLQRGHKFTFGALTNEASELAVRRRSLLIPTVVRPAFVW